MKIRQAIRTALSATILAIGIATPVAATTIVPLYLDEIVSHASVAFQGTVIGNRVELDPSTGLIVTYTKFRVDDALKGNPGAEHEIKQVGGAIEGEAPRLQIRGVPKFALGEEHVLFLAGKSAAGFSSPIGLSQGRFRVDRGNGHVRGRVSNGRDFKDLAAAVPADGMPAAVAERLKDKGPVRDLDLDDFKALVKQRSDKGNGK